MKKKPADKPCDQRTRCAIYARTATVKQPNEDNSITQQVGNCKRFAKEKGWIVREDCIFTDCGQSGLTVNSGLKDLIRIAAVNPKRFDILLCTSTDRIARDSSLVIRIREALEKHGVEIRFPELGDTQVCKKPIAIQLGINKRLHAVRRLIADMGFAATSVLALQAMRRR